MKKVWQPRSEIRAKTAKTRVLGSSLSRPSAAILVSERSMDRSRLIYNDRLCAYSFCLTG